LEDNRINNAFYLPLYYLLALRTFIPEMVLSHDMEREFAEPVDAVCIRSHHSL
jgi:hypothetical protein